jgi:hypothetical protein
VRIHVSLILFAFKRNPRVQSLQTYKYITLSFVAHPSTLDVIREADGVCLLRDAFVRHFRAHIHGGMQQEPIQSDDPRVRLVYCKYLCHFVVIITEINSFHCNLVDSKQALF